METIVFQLPKTEFEAFQKLVKKMENRIPYIKVQFGEFYKKMYRHAERDVEGFMAVTKMWHEVVDVTVEMDTINDWLLLASYKDGLEFVANPNKQLVFKNPEHGLQYNKCDLCGHWCKNSFVVLNVKTGEELQVGKECLKQFGLTGIEFVHDFTKELYRMIDCYCSFEDGCDLPCWRGDKDPFAFSSCSTKDLLRAAKAYYNEHKEWQKGSYTEDNRYIKSPSNEQVQRNVRKGVFDGSDEYIEKVIEHVKGLPANSEFSIDMAEMVNNYYTQPSKAPHAYFAIKSYEESIKAKELNVEKYTVGSQVHVRGKVVRKEVLETMYWGSTIKYTIEANGLLFERTGKIPVGEDDTVDFYAVIKFVKGLKIVLDRATKKPKKGVEVIE